MKPWKLVSLIILTILFLGSFFWQKKYFHQPSTKTGIYTFSLPIPPDVCTRFKTDPLPQVREVYITGSFINWTKDDPRYRMDKFILPDGKTNWTIALDLDGGRTLYKYVVYLVGRDDPVWVQDTSHSRLLPDGFDGFNSYIDQIDPLPIMIKLRIILLGLLVLNLCWILLPLGFPVLNQNRIWPLILLSAGVWSLGLFLYLTKMDQDQKNLLEQKTYHFADLLSFTGADRIESGFFPELQAVLKIDTSLNSEISWGRDQEIVQLSNISRISGFSNTSDFYKTFFLQSFLHPLTGEALRITWPRWGKVSPSFYNLSHTGSVSPNGIKKMEILLYPLKKDYRLNGYLGFIITPLSQKVILPEVVIYLAGLVLLSLLLSFSLRSRTDSGDASGFYQAYNITEREKDIISLVIKGANNTEIARRLFISEKTVKSHIYNIYQKAGIQNRVELINKIYKESGNDPSLP